MKNYANPQGLRAACLCSLSKYFREANRTCKLLLAVEKYPATYLEQQAILDQRLLENAAFQDFHSARSKLLEAACRYGLANVEKQRFS